MLIKNKKYKKIIFNNQGFTLIEIMIVVMLSVLVSFMGAQSFLRINSDVKKMQEKVSEKNDQIILYQFFTNLLSHSQSSFNFMKTKDDNGKNFFDLISDVSPAHNAGDTGERLIRLSPTSTTKELFFLVSDDSRGELMMYDPTFAYEISDPVDIDATVNFTYKGLNKEFSDTKTGYVKANTEAWKKGTLFLMQSPVPLRKKVTKDIVDIKTPPRQLSFLGIVNDLETDIVAPSEEPFKSMFNLINPVDEKTISNPDEFLKNLPSVGGGAPLVLLLPMKLISIKATKKTDSVKGDYITVDRVEYEGFTQKSVFNILPRVKYIEFRRTSLNVPLIEVKYEGLGSI